MKKDTEVKLEVVGDEKKDNKKLKEKIKKGAYIAGSYLAGIITGFVFTTIMSNTTEVTPGLPFETEEPATEVPNFEE